MSARLGLNGKAAQRRSRKRDQIAVDRVRLWRQTGCVNLIYTIDVERVHALDWKRDPLWEESDVRGLRTIAASVLMAASVSGA